MAVQSRVNPVIMDDSDEDDRPLVFKRNNTAAKQNSNSALKQTSSQKPEGQSSKQASEVRSSNGQSSNAQKQRPAAPIKASQDKSPTINSKTSNPSAKSPPIGNLKASSSGADQSKRPPPQKPTAITKEKSPTISSKTLNSSAKLPLTGNPKDSSSSADQSKRLLPQKPTLSKEDSPTINPQKSNSSAKPQPIGNLKASSSSADQSKRPPPQKTTPSTKEKSPTNGPKTSNSSVKSPLIGNLKACTSGADQSKCQVSRKPTPTIKEEKNNSGVKPEEVEYDSEDSEDTKPLSARVPAGSSKGNSTHANKEVSNSSQKRKVITEDSDDKRPLLSKFQNSNADERKPIGSKGNSSHANKEVNNSSQKRKLITGDSDDEFPLSSKFQNSNADEKKPVGSKGNSSYANKEVNNSSQRSKVKTEDSDDEVPLSSKFQKSNADERKPVVSKVQQNGAMKDSQVKKSPMVVNKRPLGEANNSSQSSIKKPKLVDESSPSSSKQVAVKPKYEEEDEDEDHLPISQRIKKASTSASKSPLVKKEVTKVVSKTSFKKTSKMSKKMDKKSKFSKSSKVQPGSGEGQKWTTLVHSGVIFPPPYTPHGVKMLYKGKPVDLTPEQEEVASMYAVMLETEYMTKPKFKENFMADWRKILGKNHVIQKLEDCDFKPIYEWHQKEKEKKKQMTSEEKKALKEEKMKQEEKYMWAIVDGVKEKVGNFRVEPPGLFRGRGEHPKMGKLKKRIRPSDITINIGKNTPIPECPFPGESWREIRHDNTVTWLAFWNDPINPKEFKYVFLAASSSWKGQSDKEKYEKARTLKHYIQGIRAAYTKDFTNKDVTKRQIAIATYLIDKLALRAGNEKDDDEADTVGCCTLKVENVEPIPPNILKFDFLGKDSIRYQNEVEVELPVFKAIQQFRVGKKGSDNLFDQLDTNKLNAVLKELMPGLTAKVFRTYNASITLDEMLSKGTKGGDLAEKVVVYQHANKEVAIICNHQRSVSKTHSAQMTRLNDKIDELKSMVDELKTDLSRAKKGKPPLKGSDGKNKRNLNPEALERKIAQTNAKIEKMERDKDSKEDLKTVALGTSKINYLDPRITVAWCKRNEVPMEKMFNKALLAKFAWAMDVEPDFRF